MLLKDMVQYSFEKVAAEEAPESYSEFLAGKLEDLREGFMNHMSAAKELADNAQSSAPMSALRTQYGNIKQKAQEYKPKIMKFLQDAQQHIVNHPMVNHERLKSVVNNVRNLL
jgi:hypothetical protein